MGFFGKKKAKKETKKEAAATPTPIKKKTPTKQATTTPPNDNDTPKAPVVVPDEPTLDHVPAYCDEIKAGKEPARALRMLFTLSEHKSQNRLAMVQKGKLVPTLLDFLCECEKGSSEQYLALLVLNNISIPTENKRMIALQDGGSKIFARLLCEDPSSHLMAIILVNLTFCEYELRRELANPKLELVNSLSYALKLSAMTQVAFENHTTLDEEQSVSKELSDLIQEELQLEPATSDVVAEAPLNPSDQVYPETARWCLAALKNLTRPSKNGQAAVSLVKSGIVPLIMKMITIGSEDDEEDYLNSPALWDSNSMQDAALFCIMNLAATPETREQIMGLDGVRLLTLICEHDLSGEDQMNFQRVKARMALAYLIGSSGHFGQPRGKNTSATYTSPADSVIVVSESEAGLMVELLANTLENRAKVGPGGYSAATFNVKWILFAIRCLLTHQTNQETFSSCCGARLNALLVKALAEHSIKHSVAVDSEAAEYAAFALYLQSNYGFKDQFLPAIYGNQDKLNSTGSLAAKILTSYIHMESITPAGRHAADQLLLRLRYLLFQGSVSELATQSMAESVFAFDAIELAESIYVEKRSHGSRPQDDIFGRPILRSLTKGGKSQSLRGFPSALIAVQELSFGSTRVRHSDAIDDIMVANNIANAANGDGTESYNYSWTWQDEAGSVREAMSSSSQQQPNAKPSLLGYLSCGTMCATDTTKF